MEEGAGGQGGGLGGREKGRSGCLTANPPYLLNKCTLILTHQHLGEHNSRQPVAHCCRYVNVSAISGRGAGDDPPFSVSCR